MANPNKQYLSFDYFGMDDDLMNYTVSPSTLKIQSVTESPYNISSLNQVYQSLPPVQGPMPFVGPPYSEWSNMNNMSDQQFDQFMTQGDSTRYADFDTTGAVNKYQNFLPIPENISSLDGMGPRNPFQQPDTPPDGISENWLTSKNAYFAKDFDTEEEMMQFGADELGWKGMSNDPIVRNIPSTASVDTSNTMLAGAPVSTGVGRNVGTGPSYGGAIDDATSFNNVSQRISPPSANLEDMDLSLTDVSKGQIVDPNAGAQGLFNLTNSRENYLGNIQSVQPGSLAHSVALTQVAPKDPTTIDFSKRLSDTLTAGQVPMPGDANYPVPSLPEINSANAIPEDITGMSFEEFMTPPISGEELMNNPAYNVDFGIGGGSLTDVTENQFVEVAENPIVGVSEATQLADAVPQESVIDKLGGPANILGGGMMAFGNINATKQYDNALDDIREGLNEIPNMIGETTQDALSQIDDTRSILNTSVGKAETSANQNLLASLDKLKKPRNAVGNIRTASNDIRKNLSKGLDSVIESAQERLNAQINTINENKRDQLASIDALKETLKAKEDELEKERKQSQIGTAVGVGSIFADAVLPGSGAVLRTGWNQYSSRT